MIQEKLPIWLLIIPGLLVLLYAFLSWLAFAEPTFFYTSMEIPIPEHEFMLLSWGGKNTAIVVGLLLATLTRRLIPLVIMMGVLLTMQFGDINAGVRSGVDVFLTFVGLSCVVLEGILLSVWRYRKKATMAAVHQ